MIQQHIKALEALKGKTVQAGWLESARYDDGMSVAVIARQNNFGKTINVPEHEITMYKSINEKTGEFNKYGQFVKIKKSNFAQTVMTKAYTVEIPARPFMQNAYAEFVKNQGTLQKRLFSQMIKGSITPDQMLKQIGIYLEQCITTAIKTGEYVPNAKSTVRNKGFNKPLIHTSHMLQTLISKVS